MPDTDAQHRSLYSVDLERHRENVMAIPRVRVSVLSLLLAISLFSSFETFAQDTNSSPSEELCSRGPLGLPTHTYSKKFMWENDAGITDKDYTNGMRWERFLYPECDQIFGGMGDWISGLHDRIPSRVFQSDADAKLVSITESSLGYAFGMNMYTPERISNPVPPLDDRPFTGWAYVSLMSSLRTTEEVPGTAPIAEGIRIQMPGRIRRPKSESRLELMVGALGDWAQQDRIQKEWHRWFSFEKPMGWGTQQEGTLGVNLVYDHDSYIYKSWLSDRARLSYGYGVSVGNVRTEARARIGLSISSSAASWEFLNTSLISPSDAQFFSASQNLGIGTEFDTADMTRDDPAQQRERQRRNFESSQFLTVSARIEPRYKAYDFFLDENPRHGTSTFDINRFVYDTVISIDFKLPGRRWVGAYREVQRSREIDRVDNSNHRFRQLMMIYYFN